MRAFLLLTIVSLALYVRAEDECSQYNVATCRRYLASELINNWCSSASINVTLMIDTNTSYIGNTTVFYANVTNYNVTTNASLTHIFCSIRKKSGFSFPIVQYLGCNQSNISNTSLQHTWTTIGNVTVYLFTINDTSSSYGCDSGSTTLGLQTRMNISFTLNQTNSTKPDLFKVGNITINVVTEENDWLTGYYDNDGSGSGSGIENKGEIKYIYTFSFGKNSTASTVTTVHTNRSNYSLLHHFNESRSEVIFIEVVKNDTSNTLPIFKYGSHNKSISVLAPISDPTIYLDKSSKKDTNSLIYVYVDSKGSRNITVEWILVGTGNLTDPKFKCSASNTTLASNNDKFKFNCFFNDSGRYQFNATFKNLVSTVNYTTSFVINPVPNNTVVAVSTTAVVFIVMLLVIAIVAIIVIGVYIPYRRYKNKMTETANFTFIELQKPSISERLKFQVGKVKERFSKRQQKVGLVTRSIDDDGEVLDSFYGSLNPFAAHETL